MTNRKRPRSQFKRSAPLPRTYDHSMPEPPDPVPAQLARINEISMIARTTWFGLLAYLAFVGITLLGVEDADFFAPSRQTQLPLVNVAIPTSAFFWFAPALGAALYAYLHLQLLKLWEALAAPKPRPGGRHLSDVIYPWLISDYAIALRPDGATRHRPLAYLSYSVTWLLVWAAGPLVLAGFWWRSMPKHDEGLTLGIAVALLVTLYIGLTSRWQACNLLWQTQKKSPWQGWFHRPLFAMLCLLVVAASWLRTEGGIDHYANRAVDLVNATFRTAYFRDCANRDESGHIIDRMEECDYPNGDEKDLDTVQRERIARLPFIWDLDDVTFDGETPLIGGWIGDIDTWTTLAPTDLAGVDLVPNPGDLLDHTTERRRFRKVWCDRQGIDLEVCGRLYSSAEPAPEHLERRRLVWCGQEERGIAPADCQPFFDSLNAEFREEWQQLWTSRTAALGKLDLSGVDLRRADLSGAFLIGVDLSNARMEGANLLWARLEGANLSAARMEKAFLGGARLEGADLRAARLEGASFFRARFEEANLSEARMEKAFLGGARLEGAELRGARLVGANFSGALMEDVDLGGALMEGANFSDALMEGLDLRGVRMKDAYLRGARLNGAVLSGALMVGADLEGAFMEGVDLRGARMEGANLKRAKMEGANLIAAWMKDANLREAQLAGAKLSARMEGADLSGADMEGANLNAANLRFAALTESFANTSVRAARLRSDAVTQQILNNVFGDVATKIPDGLVMPDHWDTERLEWHEGDPKFEAWLAAGAPSGMPRPYLHQGIPNGPH